MDKRIEDIVSFYQEDAKNISAISLVKIIFNLEEETRKSVLRHPIIKNRLSIGILEESSRDYWNGFREVLDYLSVPEFIGLYDAKTLEDYYHDNYIEYILYGSCLERDANSFIKIIMDDEAMLDRVLRKTEGCYGLYSRLDYDLYKEVVLRTEDKIMNYPKTFYCSCPIESEEKIIQENIKDETLVYLLSNFGQDAKNSFFKNNPKSLSLYNQFDIVTLADDGTTFSDEILKRRDFFEKLKLPSFIDFRRVMNHLEEHNNIRIIENHINDYYDELINSYNAKTGMFKQYEKKLSHLEEGFDFQESPLFITKDGYYEIMKYTKYDNDQYSIDKKEKLKQELKEITGYKINELLSDILFKDNYHNICLNIREMLRYNQKLTDKVLDEEKEEFYRMILNLDTLSSNIKMNVIKEFRDLQVDFMFYNDIRKMKDISYDIINSELYKVNNDIFHYQKELSEEYGVKVFDLRDAEYTMLIRKQNYNNLAGPISSYSLITNENNVSFHDYLDEKFIYGYHSFSKDRVSHVFEADSYSMYEDNDSPSKFVNRIMNSEEIVKNRSSYSEIVLKNKKSTNNDKYLNKKPDFLVVYDKIEDRDIKESKRLDIPIVLIKKKELAYTDNPKIGFDREKDIYISHAFEENTTKDKLR